MATNNFEFAVRDAIKEEDEDVYEFYLNGGDPFYAMFPTEGQITLFMGIGAESSVGGMTAALTLLESVLLDDGFRRIKEMLSDRNSALNRAEQGPFKILMNIIQSLIQADTSFPTAPPSSSTGSQPKTGRSSTASSQPRASTRSRSPRVASAT